MSSATEKKYRFTFEKVIEYLDIDEKEQETICLKPAGVRKKEREMAKKRAEENRKRRKEEKRKEKTPCIGAAHERIYPAEECRNHWMYPVNRQQGYKRIWDQMQKRQKKNNRICQTIHTKKRKNKKQKSIKKWNICWRQIQSFVPQWTN